MTTITTTDRPEEYRDNTFGRRDHEAEGSLKAKDMVGALLAAVMTLGPLAATALFAH